METNHLENERYERAAKRVKRIKGFYTHLVVYIVINIAIILINFQNHDSDGNYFIWMNFSTLIFWGIGLLAHGLSVFLPGMILGKDWEERKIKELMDKEKKPWK